MVRLRDSWRLSLPSAYPQPQPSGIPCDPFSLRPYDTLRGLARFKTTASGGGWRSLKDYVGSLRENQTAIYYVTGSDLTRLETSPQLEGFQARGVEGLLLPDPVDSFWVTAGVEYEGKPFKSVTQGAADLALIPRVEPKGESDAQTSEAVARFIAGLKAMLGEQV